MNELIPRDSPRRRAWTLTAIALVIGLIAYTTWIGSKPTTGLILFVPAAEPSAIQTSSVPTTVVRFAALVAGTSTPSKILCRDREAVVVDALCLHEVDAAGKPLSDKPTAILRRHDEKGTAARGDLVYGKGVGKQARNLAYTGTADVPSAKDAEKYYRVRAEYLGQNVTSAVATFGITSLNLNPRPSNRKLLVKDPKGPYRLFSNEVVMTLRPGLLSDPDRIRKISTAVGGTVEGVIPALRTYLLQIASRTEAGVREAIAVLQQSPDVERAFPNFEVVAEAMPGETPVGCASDTANCQWFIEHVGIDKAWRAVDGLSTSIPVAIFDDSGVDGTHPDLAGPATDPQCVPGGGVAPCNNHSCRPHGTWVAGVVGATANNGGIAGVAWDTPFWSYRYDPSVGSSYNLSDAIQSATQLILNISLTSGDVLRGAVEKAICDGRLIVAAAGNVGKMDVDGDGTVECPFNSADQVVRYGLSAKYPAAYNALPDTLACLAETDKSLSSRILAVGATDIQNKLAEWPLTDPCNNLTTQNCGNLQDWIDIFAPGKNIYTTNYPATRPYEYVGGTSLATAIVSGAAAVLWGSKPPLSWTAKQIHDELISKATVLTSTADPWPLAGKRLINLSAAMGTAFTTVYDFETPSLGSAERQTMNPYVQPGVSFSIMDNFGFSDAVVGLVRNRATSACAEPRDVNQKLGTGRDPYSPDSIGLSGFPIRAQFNPVLRPLGTPVEVSVEVQTGDGAAVRLRLFDQDGMQVAQDAKVASPADGTCGFPGTARARTTLTANAVAPVAYAIIDLPGNTPSGGRVFVIDNVKLVAGSP